MEGKRKFFIVIVLGLVIGWVLGFYFLPHMVKDFSFLMGFTACLLLFSGVLLLKVIWNKWSNRKKTASDSSGQSSSSSLLVIVCIVLLGMVGSYVLFKQNEIFQAQTEDQKKIVRQHLELVEAAKNSNMVLLMDNLLNQVHDELEESPERKLSAKTIARIASLSQSFQPYAYLEADTLSAAKYSPERGQLLLALVFMDMDSSSFEQIRLKVTFASADLREAELTGKMLNDIDLKGANLRDANLSGAHLENADLRSANLWGAKINKAKLNDAIMNRAMLSWAELNSAELNGAILDGADMVNAKMRQTMCTEASIQWANLEGSIFADANVSGTNFKGTSFAKGSFNNADLTDVYLKKVNLTDANLEGAILTGVGFEAENWLDRLTAWNVVGASEIQSNYDKVKNLDGEYEFILNRMVEDTSTTESDTAGVTE